MTAPALTDKVQAIREAAEGAGIVVTDATVGSEGVTVMYGSWDDAGEAARLASGFLADPEATGYWRGVGPLGLLRGVWAQTFGREWGRYGHVLPFADVDGLIEGLRAEWRARYAEEQGRRHPALVAAYWRALTVVDLSAALVLAFLCAAASHAGDRHTAVWLGVAAVFAVLLAPSWESIPDATEPPAVTA